MNVQIINLSFEEKRVHIGGQWVVVPADNHPLYVCSRQVAVDYGIATKSWLGGRRPPNQKTGVLLVVDDGVANLLPPGREDILSPGMNYPKELGRVIVQ